MRISDWSSDVCSSDLRLRKSGAIIMGTNSMLGAGGGGALAGEGIFKPFNWEAEARSPWDTSRVPGWSSSGGAAAVAAGMLPVAIGSDGGGSTRLPAAYSGAVGMHPTGGLIPRPDSANPRPHAGTPVAPLPPPLPHAPPGTPGTA